MLQNPLAAVKYEFETEGGDIDFGITFTSTGSGSAEEEEIISISRISSDVEPIRGQFKAPSEGVIMFKWNNEYSWFTSKSLSYMIDMVQVLLPCYNALSV